MDNSIEKENVLKSIYYDAKNPSSFSSVNKLYNAAIKILPSLTINEVKDWLSGEFTYTLHKPLRKNFPRSPIIVEHKHQQWEADLVEMQEFARKNKGYRYMLTVIDVMTKYSWAIPVKDKTALSIVNAFYKIFKEKKPVFLRTDKGKEFLNTKLKQLLFKFGVYHFTSKKFKCAVVERFNRTLKSRMYKYFTAKGTRKWIDILPDLVKAYNNSAHRSIKMTPLQALRTDDKILFKKLYKNKILKKTNLNIGDKVRKQYELGPFDKSFYPNWTDKIYKIESKSNSMYKINKEIGRLYPQQVQGVKENLYRVEKVLRKRIYKGKKEVYVKWLGYSDTYNQWIPASNLINL